MAFQYAWRRCAHGSPEAGGCARFCPPAASFGFTISKPAGIGSTSAIHLRESFAVIESLTVTMSPALNAVFSVPFAST